MIELSKIEHPRKVCVPLAIGLAWGNDGNESGFWTQEKLDGEFATREWRGNLLAGELMTDGSFVVWDILSLAGVGDIRGKPLRERLTALALAGDALRADGLEIVQTSFFYDNGHAGQFLERIIARGGEGVVRKSLNATYYDTMTACKRLETWICRVTGIGPGQSVTICDQVTGEARGRLPLRSGKCDAVRIGSVLKVNGLGLTAKGLIRDPRPDSDSSMSWLISP